MATTLNAIAEYLDSRSWEYTVDKAKTRIIAGVKADNIKNFVIVFQLLHEGKSLQIYAPQLLEVKNSVFKGVLFQSILSFLWDYPLVRFEYDRLDGEIRATVDLLLEDAPLTDRQCGRALSILIELVDTNLMPRMQSILATGNDPGRKILAKKMLDRMPDEMVDLLSEAIRDRQLENDGNSFLP